MARTMTSATRRSNVAYGAVPRLGKSRSSARTSGDGRSAERFLPALQLDAWLVADAVMDRLPKASSLSRTFEPLLRPACRWRARDVGPGASTPARRRARLTCRRLGSAPVRAGPCRRCRSGRRTGPARLRHTRAGDSPALRFRVGVDVDEHSVRRLSLPAMAGHGVAVVQVRMCVDSDRDGAARLQPQMKPPWTSTCSRVASSRFATVGAVRRGELHAVAYGKRAFVFAIERDALQPPRIVGDPSPDWRVTVTDCLASTGSRARTRRRRARARCSRGRTARRRRSRTAPPIGVGAGDVLPRHQHAPLMLVDLTCRLLQQPMNGV